MSRPGKRPRSGSDRPLNGLPDEVRRRLRHEREQHGWSLRALGERSGLSPSYLSLIESGARLPDVEAATRLAEALELAPRIRDAFLASVRLARGYRKDSSPEEALLWARTWTQLQPVLDHPDLETRTVDESSVRMDQDDGLLDIDDSADMFGAPVPSSPAQPEDDLVRIPLLREGCSLDDSSEIGEWLRVDPAVLPPRADLSRAYAWRLSERSIERIADMLAPGDVVILAPVDRNDVPSTFERRDVWVVSHDGALVLTRLQAAGSGEGLMLLPPSGSDLEVEFSRDGLNAIRARVVAAIRSWWH